ncbi:MAG TPA: hypothetical protein VFB58_12430 [Chloroflexota bacterium]|nr:hypothetical protein [Chloroflexota bacterium]
MMSVWLFVIVAVLVLSIGALAVIAVRGRRQRDQAPPIETMPVDPAQERATRQASDTLLGRRVELEDNRGALAGHDDIEVAFDRLEARLTAGEITPDDYEAEKIRLLS